MHQAAEQPTIAEIPDVVLNMVLAKAASAEDASLPVADLIEARRKSEGWKAIDDLEVALKDAPPPAFIHNHHFTPVPDYPELCLYTREIMMPESTVLTSGIHLFEHPYTISYGRVWIWTADEGWVHHWAGETNITRAGTRRVLFVPRCGGCVFVTQHVTKKGTPDEIRARITFDHLKLGHLAEVPAVRHRLTQ